MGLWIRSQDKKRLSKATEIHIEDTGIDFCISDYENDFGRYATKKRALEVLDEIQKTIETHILSQASTEWETWLKGTVYEMPKE